VRARTGLAIAEPDSAKLFTENCAECHGADQLGQRGPALLPENLGRITGARAASVIADGRAATQMPSFAVRLSKEEIAVAALGASSRSSVGAEGPCFWSLSRRAHLLTV
jgi:dihydro-heme d1 dehydrogenase